ncbi:hypothetical protein DIPPA_05276 [Diplonema papillatum]|nr:hypothetical protein DIPPA_05276 [Diplonema papillatum]
MATAPALCHHDAYTVSDDISERNRKSFGYCDLTTPSASDMVSPQPAETASVSVTGSDSATTTHTLSPTTSVSETASRSGTETTEATHGVRDKVRQSLFPRPHNAQCIRHGVAAASRNRFGERGRKRLCHHDAYTVSNDISERNCKSFGY